MPLELSNSPFSTSWKTTPSQNVPTVSRSKINLSQNQTQSNRQIRKKRFTHQKTEFDQKKNKIGVFKIVMNHTSCLVTRMLRRKKNGQTNRNKSVEEKERRTDLEVKKPQPFCIVRVRRMRVCPTEPVQFGLSNSPRRIRN